MNKKIIRVVVPILILVELCFCFLTYMSFQNKDIDKQNEISKVDRKRFAMYKENEEGEYEEITDGIFPSGYLLNTDKSMCVDSNDNVVDNILVWNNNKLTITSNKTVYCYLYFDMKQPDIKINVTTEGEAGVVPTTGGFISTLSCNDSTYSWNQKYQRIEFSGVSSASVKCNLDYKYEPSNHNSLIFEVKDKATQYSFSLGDYTNAPTLTQSEYKTPTQFSSNSDTSTSGTTVTNAFTYSGTKWSSVPANLTSGTYYYIKFNIPTEGYYQLCYTMSSGSPNNLLYAYKNTTALKFAEYNYETAFTSSSKNGCIEVGKVTTSDTLKVVQRAYSSGSYPISTVSFYLKKTTNVTTYDTGYRYSGKSPNNWVWFNNELWRIIGSIPTCTSSGCVTSENLVKIIRNDSIGVYVYDGSSTGAWGSNTLYSLLNTHYYATSTTNMNGQSHAGCYGWYDSSYKPKPNCDYSRIGILSSSYYGKMIKNVYWNTGASNDRVTPSEAYVNETSKQTVSGHIGLMTASDWGYAADSSYHNTSMFTYTFDSNKATETSWIYNGGEEWTNIQYSSRPQNVLMASMDGVLNNGGVDYGNAVRPVIYLDSSVYVVSGDGSISNPYIIGI